MQFIDALIEAEAQLDFGSNPTDIERALSHVKAVAPSDPLIRPLQMKLVQLKLRQELLRVETGRPFGT